jgi:esterase
LLGHSMGGKTAMACALAAPDSVRRLLVADIAPIAYAHHNAGIAAAMQGLTGQPEQPGLTRAQADAMLCHAVPDAGVRGFLLQNFVAGDPPGWRIGLSAIAASIGDIEAWPAVFGGSRYEGPVLFVSGARSDYITSAGRDAARLLFPHARFLALKNAGHWVHADQPEAFAHVAADFFGR